MSLTNYTLESEYFNTIEGMRKYINQIHLTKKDIQKIFYNPKTEQWILLYWCCD